MRRVSVKSPPSSGDLSAGRRVPVPLCSRWRIAAPFSAVIWPPDDGGDARRRARTAHTARQAERARPEAGRLTAETAATAGRAPRAQPTLANGQRTREVVPLPPLKFPLGCDPEGGARRGEGGSALWARRGKGNDPTRNRTLSSAPRHGKRCGHRPSKRPEARRGRAGWAQRPRASPSRGRTGERGQRPSRPDGRRRGGQRARELPHLHPTPQHGRDHAHGRRHGGQGGRRRRRPGGTRARLLAATHAISAGRTFRAHQQRGRRRRERRARGAGRGHDRRARNTPAQRSEQRKAERTGNRASRRAQSGRARRRSGRIWPPVRLCGGFFRWWWAVLPFQCKKRKKGRKNANSRVDMCRTWLYTGYGRVEHARKECRTWKPNGNGLSRPRTRDRLARGCRMSFTSA